MDEQRSSGWEVGGCRYAHAQPPPPPLLPATMHQDAVKRITGDELPDFYNIVLERPKDDPDGYDVLFVDAAAKVGKRWRNGTVAVRWESSGAAVGCLWELCHGRT